MGVGATILADMLSHTVEMINMHLADFSDADMFARPCAGANHATWQLGQFTAADHHFVELVAPGVMPPLPPGFGKQFTKETAASDDPAKFPNKQQMLDQLKKTRAASAAWARSLTDEQLTKPTPESIRRFAKTVGDLAMMLSIHSTMHLGQIQVIRRKLGKPVLF